MSEKSMRLHDLGEDFEATQPVPLYGTIESSPLSTMIVKGNVQESDPFHVEIM